LLKITDLALDNPLYYTKRRKFSLSHRLCLCIRWSESDHQRTSGRSPPCGRLWSTRGNTV